jgi:hypothetical protein
MFKFLRLSTITATTFAGAFYGYKNLTKFETNITVSNVQTKKCIIKEIKRHMVDTEKGIFVLKNDFKLLYLDIGPIDYQYKPTFELNKDSTYHVTCYGLDYPKLHLYRIIISNNGTPCKLNDHCGEKKSILSSIFNKI